MSKEQLAKRLNRLPLVDGERRGDDGTMYRVRRLEPLPISFDEERHKYVWLPTNETMAHSVTEIVGATKDPGYGQHHGHKSVWEPEFSGSRTIEHLRMGPIQTLLGGHDAWLSRFLIQCGRPSR